jgi:hypothetical protein
LKKADILLIYGFYALILFPWFSHARTNQNSNSPGFEIPTVNVETDRDIITVGDLFTLKVEVSYPKSLVVKLPGARSDFGTFEIREHRYEGPDETATGQLLSSVYFVLTVFQVGELEIPALTVSYTDSLDAFGEIQTEPVKIKVSSVLGKSEEGIQDLKPPISMPRDWMPIILGLLAFSLVMAILTFVYRKYLRKLRKGKETLSAGPSRPAHERALEELQKLRGKELLSRADKVHYYTRASEIVREYVEDRFHIDALEMTSSEVLEKIKPELESQQVTEILEQFLAKCDLVKFAKFQPSHDESESLLENAITFVEYTKEDKVDEENPQSAEEVS